MLEREVVVVLKVQRCKNYVKKLNIFKGIKNVVE